MGAISMTMLLLHDTLLAQTERAATAIFGWALSLIVLLIVMVIAVFWFKKRMSATQEYQPGGFTLADLRDLRKSGAMSEEEFERAKAKVVEGLRAATTAAAKKTESDPRLSPKIPPANGD